MLQRIGSSFICYRFKFDLLSSSVFDLYGIYRRFFFFYQNYLLVTVLLLTFEQCREMGAPTLPTVESPPVNLQWLCGYSGYVVSHLQVQSTVGHVVPSLHYWKKFDLHSSNASCSRISCVLADKGGSHTFVKRKLTAGTNASRSQLEQSMVVMV